MLSIMGVPFVLVVAVLGSVVLSTSVNNGCPCSPFGQKNVVSPRITLRDLLSKPDDSQHGRNLESSLNTNNNVPNEEEYRYPNTEFFWQSIKQEVRQLWNSLDDPNARLLKRFDEMYTKGGLIRPMIPDEFGNRVSFRAPIENQSARKQLFLDQLDKVSNCLRTKKAHKQFVKMHITIRALFKLVQTYESVLLEARPSSSQPYASTELREMVEQGNEFQSDLDVLKQDFCKAIAAMLKGRTLAILAESITERMRGLETLLCMPENDLDSSIDLVQQEQKTLKRVFTEFCSSDIPVKMQDFDQQLDKFFESAIDLKTFAIVNSQSRN